MQVFITILDEIAKIEDVVNRNEDLVSIITVLQYVTQKMLGFRALSEIQFVHLRGYSIFEGLRF
jgi:hypothetical protein